MKQMQHDHLDSMGRKRDGMTTSVGRDTVVGREKGGDDTSWTDVNFTGLKNNKKFTR
jgi:hypothetical protein